jgi:hypothetical protein
LALGHSQLPVHWGVHSQPEKWPELDVDCSPPSSTEVKNEWSYTSDSPYAFMVWMGLYLFNFYSVLIIFHIVENRTVK